MKNIRNRWNNFQSDEPAISSQSRREFMVSAGTAIAGVGVANLLKLQTAIATNTKDAVTIGDRPYPAEGMAAYSPTGAHRLMKVSTSRSCAKRRCN